MILGKTKHEQKNGKFLCQDFLKSRCFESSIQIISENCVLWENISRCLMEHFSRIEQVAELKSDKWR